VFSVVSINKKSFIGMRYNVSGFHKLLPSLFLFLFLSGASSLLMADDASIQKGGELFRANCSACHKVDKQLVGPALKGVKEKYAGDMEWLYKWIKNSPGLIQSGDEKAVALWEQYNKQAMQAFPLLADEDISAILDWIEAEGNKADEPAITAVPAGGGQDPFADPGLYYALLALVGVLVLIAFLLVVITATLVTAVRAKDQKEPLRVADIWGMSKRILGNKFVITAITIFVVVGGSVKLIQAARGVSLHQGYMPEQPIKFSHKTHAGKFEIQCEYCHSGVTKSKNAWVPSVNVCMNCHKGIQEGPTYGTVEIGKILAAYENNEPIEWIRIHNLPDHAYFNHAQHYVVGGVECQTCHGPIQEMEVVYQYSKLSMGWCIKCHRETKVKSLGKETDYTVEDMGGLDCARCHY
jgi:mono/diheme cytochrome c family protein